MTDALLEVAHLDSHYGRAQALFDIGLAVRLGEAAALLGRNGAGKSTALKSIMGLVRVSRGTIRFRGREIAGAPPSRIARLGIGYVPEDRRIFPALTVRENLEVGRQPPREGAPEWTPERLFELFPPLAALAGRAGGSLSGGEQQMLALARTLMGNPLLLLLDEPSEGLAPLLVEALGATLAELKREGIAILLSEQNLRLSRRVVDRAYLIESGRLRFAGAFDSLLRDEALRSFYMLT